MRREREREIESEGGEVSDKRETRERWRKRDRLREQRARSMK